MKARVLIVVALLIVVGVALSVWYYQAAKETPLIEGAPQMVRDLAVQQVDFIREPDDPGNIVRGVKIYSKGGFVETVYHRPNDDSPTIIRFTGLRKEVGLYYEVYEVPLYRIYPLGIKTQVGKMTEYDLYILTDLQVENPQQLQLEEGTSQ